jgi:hypothetical protein
MNLREEIDKKLNELTLLYTHSHQILVLMKLRNSNSVVNNQLLDSQTLIH